MAGGTGPDWQNFTILLPGSAGTPQQQNSSTSPGQVVSINGNLPYSNVLADGVSSTLSHSQNADVSIFETVAELQVNTSAFSAQYGIGGVIFNQISKGGTNQWHGAGYEYLRNNYFNSRSTFSPSVMSPCTSSITASVMSGPRPQLSGTVLWCMGRGERGNRS